jgi:hypothetical protein
MPWWFTSEESPLGTFLVERRVILEELPRVRFVHKGVERFDEPRRIFIRSSATPTAAAVG